jgi:conjugative transposon TraN protein
MKISIIAIAVSLLLSTAIKAQQGIAADTMETIPSIQLSIAANQTTHLIFPLQILSVDRGSADLLAQKAKGLDNVLQVKAARDSFPLTSLSVITEDGKLYSFLVSYDSLPSQLNYRFGGILKVGDSVVSTALKPGLPTDTGRLANIRIASEVAVKKNGMRGIRDKKYGMSLSLKGVFIHGDVIYLKLMLRNRTHIGYDVDLLRFSIRDRQQAKRTAMQENEQVPLLIYGNAATVRGKTGQTVIVALPKFTIPDKKILYIQLMEKNGGRHLQLRAGNRTIVKAAPVYK